MKIQEVIEYEVPVDLTSDSAIDLLKELEKKVKELKEVQGKQIRERLDGRKKVKNEKYEFKEVEVYRKVLDLEVIDKKFTKTEVKPNIETIKEYKKDKGRLPEGVQEVFHYSRYSVSNLDKKAFNEEQRRKYLEAQKPSIENPLKDIKFKKKGESDE